MSLGVTRRGFLRIGAGVAGVAVAAPRVLVAQSSAGAETLPLPSGTSVVSLVRGEDRRRNVAEALEMIEEQILPRLREKKYVLIKPNLVSSNQPLASTHKDTVHGILDFLDRRYQGPVVIAESAAGSTATGYDNLGFTKLSAEHKGREITLVDLNAEGRYKVLHILDDSLHLQPVRLAERLLDADAFIICSAVMKTHNAVVATLSVKNMALGAPLRSGPKETKRWSDKRRYHVGVRQMHYNILLTAERMRPFWGATVVDGFEGMEGNGPGQGMPVASRVAVASTDYVAADRVAVECMGINPAWVGYLGYCGELGIGQYNLAKIEVRGAKVGDVKRTYQLHQDIERMLQWMGPMTELPPNLG